MEYKRLGESELLVSEICLGTMTYGHQNTIEDASQQLDYAVAQGINFIDTAEMYPVPGRAQTQGKTEEYIGEGVVQKARGKRIIGTKVAGPASRLSWIRGEKRRIDRP